MAHVAPTGNHKPGDRVQVQHSGSEWRDAVIVSMATYGGGYYYHYDPLPGKGPDGISPSAGGWTCDTYCRERP